MKITLHNTHTEIPLYTEDYIESMWWQMSGGYYIGCYQNEDKTWNVFIGKVFGPIIHSESGYKDFKSCVDLCVEKAYLKFLKISS